MLCSRADLLSTNADLEHERKQRNKDTLEKYGYPPIDLSSLNNGLVHHQWIYFYGKQYDAEKPNGVNKWFELPIFQRKE